MGLALQLTRRRDALVLRGLRSWCPGYTLAHPETTETVRVLNEIISDIDESCDAFGVEKIKTIGAYTSIPKRARPPRNRVQHRHRSHPRRRRMGPGRPRHGCALGSTYMAMAGGLPTTVPGPHPERMAEFLLNIQQIIARSNAALHLDFQIRMGMNVGPVVTGVIGTQKVVWRCRDRNAAPVGPCFHPGAWTGGDGGEFLSGGRPLVCLRCLGRHGECGIPHGLDGCAWPHSSHEACSQGTCAS